MAYYDDAPRAGVPHPNAEFLVRGPFHQFRNIEPRSREARRALVDKEALEKQRLIARTGGFHKYEYMPTHLLTGMPEGAPGYQGESGRFDTDSAAEEARVREANRARKHQAMAHRREETVMRAEEREREALAELERERAYERYLREESLKAKANEGSMPFDPITLEYASGEGGDRLRHDDAEMRHRAALRAQHLQSKNMAEPYNPITGKPVRDVPIPQHPGQAPERLRSAGRRVLGQ